MAPEMRSPDLWPGLPRAGRIRVQMIILRDIGLRRGSKLLLEHANVTIQPGQRLALIGANGSGKSTLFALLLGELVADTGDIEGMARLRLAHMAQEVHATGMPAGEYVWRGDSTLAGLRDELQRLESAGRFDAAAAVHGGRHRRRGCRRTRRACARRH